MSATRHTQTSDSPEYECGHCGGSHTPAETVAGAFCSQSCHDAHRREKRAAAIFRELEQDHRFCATCGKQLKEIEKPTDEALRQIDGYHSTTSVVGYQYRTEYADVGEISLDVRAGFKHGETVRVPTRDGVATGTVCECGNTAHRHEEDAIRKRSPFETAHFLWLAARVLRAEDKHDVRLDRGRVFDAVLEQAVPVQETDSVDVRAALERAVILDG